MSNTETSSRTLSPVSDNNLLQWARWQAENDRIEAARQEAEKAEKELRERESRRRDRIASLQSLLIQWNLPLEIVEDAVRFGPYELRYEHSAWKHAYCLRVWAPAPYDIADDWEEDQPAIRAGQLAYAGVDIGAAYEMAQWLLHPRVSFPRAKDPLAEVRPTLTVERKERYRIAEFPMHLASCEDRDAWVNDQADEGYVLHSMTVSPSMTSEPNTLVIVMALPEAL